MASLPPEAFQEQRLTTLASIPDGLKPEDDRQDFVKLTDSILRVMPGHLMNLIHNINRSNAHDQITCVVAETAAGWALEVANKMGIKPAAVLLSGPPSMALTLHVPQLIEAGIIDTDGTVIKDEVVRLSEGIPAWSSSEFTWRSCDPVMQKLLISYISTSLKTLKFTEQILCNSFYELDSSVMKLIPKIVPIGPIILASNDFEAFAGNLRPEDSPS